MNIIENVNRLEDYLINESEISLIDIQKISTYLTNIREEAINYTSCSMELKDKEKLNFDEWCNIFGYTKSNDKFTKRGINYSESNLLSLYKTEYLENL